MAVIMPYRLPHRLATSLLLPLGCPEARARLRASEVARRRGEEEGAEALFPPRVDDELGAFMSAMREQPPKGKVPGCQVPTPNAIPCRAVLAMSTSPRMLFGRAIAHRRRRRIR
jgi:hypothetical protein